MNQIKNTVQYSKIKINYYLWLIFSNSIFILMYLGFIFITSRKSIEFAVWMLLGLTGIGITILLGYENSDEKTKNINSKFY